MELGDALAGALGRTAERLAAMVAGAPLALDGPVVAPDEGDPAFRRLRELALDDVDLGLLVSAAAPDLDRRLGPVLGAAAGEASRRRTTVGVALELNGLDAADAADRWRLGPVGPLVRTGLLVVDEPERPFPERALRVPDRVVAHLLGDDAPDPALEPLLGVAVPAPLVGVEALATSIDAGRWFTWVHERGGTAGASLAVSALADLGVPSLVVDLGRLAPGATLADVVVVAIREASLTGRGLVLTGVDGERDRGAYPALADAGCPALLVSSEPWDPRWATLVPHAVEAPRAGQDARRAVWDLVLAEVEAEPGAADDVVALPLTPEAIVGATAVALRLADDAGRRLRTADLVAGVRSRNAGRLTSIARRTTPEAGWDRLVLPEPMLEDLRALVGRARDRDLVRDTWGMAGGRGVSALFAGPSGTGKTLSAEVVAGALGGDLYTVDLSQVVDKYIGETEKKLERVFTEAEGVNGVLFFDEADALFGKRSGVSDAHDRYANVEVAYLLQRVESFEGVLLLATNLHANVDEAFARRLDLTLRYPAPGEPERLELWRRHLPPTLPMADDVDLGVLAAAAEVTGGAIRNAAVTAAFAAARRGSPVTMADLVAATAKEYENLGRLLDLASFGGAARPSG